LPALGNAPQPADHFSLVPDQSGSIPTVRCVQGTTNSHPEPNRKECVPVWKFYGKMEDTFDMSGSMMMGLNTEFICYLYCSLCRTAENIGGIYVCQIMFNSYISSKPTVYPVL
jgi:hypothetical protein